MFTLEQIREIKERLINSGSKDTQLPEAELPLSGEETVAIIQDGENKKIPIREFYTEISSTYTKAEVDRLINAIKQFTYESASVLPQASASTMNKIYLIPSDNAEDNNVKDEYITVQDGSQYKWEQIGSTSVDLTNYYNMRQVNELLEDKADKTDLLGDYYAE